MHAKLVACTSVCGEGVPKLGSCEDLVAYCARVSNPSNQMNTDTSGKLISYLKTHNHWSPFEMVHIVLEVHTTRDIARQLLRHRSFTFQEFSQRYATVAAVEPVLREARVQDSKNRQNSIQVDDEALQREWEQRQTEAWKACNEAYAWALESGIAKEVARCVLPEGLTPSTLYVSGSLRSWMHYVSVRTDPSTQREHRELAEACAAAIRPKFSLI